LFLALIIREVDSDQMLLCLMQRDHSAKERRDYPDCDPGAKPMVGFLPVAQRGDLIRMELDNLAVLQVKVDSVGADRQSVSDFIRANFRRDASAMVSNLIEAALRIPVRRTGEHQEEQNIQDFHDSPAANENSGERKACPFSPAARHEDIIVILTHK